MQPGISIASISNGTGPAMLQMLLTDLSLPEECASRTDQAVVLHCLNDGYSVLAARGIYRWTDERERIAHMRYVRFLALDQFFHCPV